MPLAVAYLRVSTLKQEAEAQRKAITDFAEKMGFEIVWFEEPEGTSGGTPAFERPRFREMWNFLESNPHVRDIIVFEISRLGRDYDDLKQVLAKLGEKGVRLWIVTLPSWNQLIKHIADDDNPLTRLLYKLIADLIVSVMAFGAAQERLLISLRTKAGMQRAKEMGKHVGRPRYPFPSDKVKKLLARGLKRREAWLLLKASGDICMDTKKGRRCMDYTTFIHKVKDLGLIPKTRRR